MLAINTTLRKIQIDLSTTVTTNQLDFTSQYQDIRYENASISYGTTVGTTNNTTAVDVVPSPTSGVVRVVSTITVYNKDTANAVVYINFVDSGTEYRMVQVTLSTGDQLVYSDESGWGVYSSTGDKKLV